MRCQKQKSYILSSCTIPKLSSSQNANTKKPQRVWGVFVSKDLDE